MDVSEEDAPPRLLEVVKNTALLPVNVLTSPPARRTYVRTLLLGIAAFLLAIAAVVAYAFFYYSYVPQLGFSRPVHLQFPTISGISIPGPRFPSGEAAIPKGGLASRQIYDIRVKLHMPRAPVNLDAGNFMLEGALLGAATSQASVRNALKADTRPVISTARRPAIMTYVSPMVDQASKVAAIGLYMTGWRGEGEWLEVSLWEGVDFKSKSEVPEAVRLELQSDSQLRVYDVSVDFRARFSGLRWLMYNHRIMSFTLFTSLFWSLAMGTTVTIWLATSLLLASGQSTPPKSASIRHEEDTTAPSDGLSDVSRQFPTYSRQPPLRYSASEVKREDEDEDEDDSHLSGELLEPKNEEVADDEDEDADFIVEERLGARSDSGLGTSMESSSGYSSVRRRRDK